MSKKTIHIYTHTHIHPPVMHLGIWSVMFRGFPRVFRVFQLSDTLLQVTQLGLIYSLLEATSTASVTKRVPSALTLLATHCSAIPPPAQHTVCSLPLVGLMRSCLSPLRTSKSPLHPLQGTVAWYWRTSYAATPTSPL